eukprot:218522-Chlamydomonas_euryale.AAC.1
MVTVAAAAPVGIARGAVSRTGCDASQPPSLSGPLPLIPALPARRMPADAAGRVTGQMPRRVAEVVGGARCARLPLCRASARGAGGFGSAPREPRDQVSQHAQQAPGGRGAGGAGDPSGVEAPAGGPDLFAPSLTRALRLAGVLGLLVSDTLRTRRPAAAARAETAACTRSTNASRLRGVPQVLATLRRGYPTGVLPAGLLSGAGPAVAVTLASHPPLHAVETQQQQQQQQRQQQQRRKEPARLQHPSGGTPEDPEWTVAREDADAARRGTRCVGSARAGSSYVAARPARATDRLAVAGSARLLRRVLRPGAASDDARRLVTAACAETGRGEAVWGGTLAALGKVGLECPRWTARVAWATATTVLVPVVLALAVDRRAHQVGRQVVIVLGSSMCVSVVAFKALGAVPRLCPETALFWPLQAICQGPGQLSEGRVAPHGRRCGPAGENSDWLGQQGVAQAKSAAPAVVAAANVVVIQTDSRRGVGTFAMPQAQANRRYQVWGGSSLGCEQREAGAGWAACNMPHDVILGNDVPVVAAPRALHTVVGAATPQPSVGHRSPDNLTSCLIDDSEGLADDDNDVDAKVEASLPLTQADVADAADRSMPLLQVLAWLDEAAESARAAAGNGVSAAQSAVEDGAAYVGHVVPSVAGELLARFQTALAAAPRPHVEASLMEMAAARGTSGGGGAASTATSAAAAHATRSDAAALLASQEAQSAMAFAAPVVYACSAAYVLSAYVALQMQDAAERRKGAHVAGRGVRHSAGLRHPVTSGAAADYYLTLPPTAVASAAVSGTGAVARGSARTGALALPARRALLVYGDADLERIARAPVFPRLLAGKWAAAAYADLYARLPRSAAEAAAAAPGTGVSVAVAAAPPPEVGDVGTPARVGRQLLVPAEMRSQLQGRFAAARGRALYALLPRLAHAARQQPQLQTAGGVKPAGQLPASCPTALAGDADGAGQAMGGLSGLQHAGIFLLAGELPH